MLTPGSPLDAVLLAPLAREDFERAIETWSEELELELLGPVPAGRVIAGDGWSALVGWRAGFADEADLVACALLGDAAEVYVLGFAPPQVLHYTRDAEEPAQLTDEPRALGERLLGRTLPGALGVWGDRDPDGRLPASVLGAASAPSTFAVRVADEDYLRVVAGGVLELTEDAPLFDTRIFGARGARFGAIALPNAVVHPWLLRTTSTPDIVRALAYGERVVVGAEIVDPANAATDAELLVGGDAVAALVEAGALPGWLADAVLSVLPVLPSGLRGMPDGGDLTALYELVLQHVDRVDDAFDGASPTVQGHEVALLQRAVDALFVDGAVGDCEQLVACVPDATPSVRSLRHHLDRGWVDDIDGMASSERSGVARAYLEASALAVVPLDPSGTIDEAAVSRGIVERRARMFAEAYAEHLGPLHANVLHDASGPPHIDVYATEARADGTRLLVTAGASGRAMMDDPRKGGEYEPFVELAMKVPAALGLDLVEHLMRGLLALARYPFQHGTFLAPLHTVSAGRAIGPGTTQTAFVFANPKDAVLEALALALPGSPTFVLVLGITPAELTALDGAGNRGASVAALVKRTRGVTDLARR